MMNEKVKENDRRSFSFTFTFSFIIEYFLPFSSSFAYNYYILRSLYKLLHVSLKIQLNIRGKLCLSPTDTLQFVKKISAKASVKNKGSKVTESILSDEFDIQHSICLLTLSHTCTFVCRTSSFSVHNQNTYRDDVMKYCFGLIT